MSYLIQSKLVADASIKDRVIACAAVEGVVNPEAWAHEQRWSLSAQPGWVAAYASAIAGGDTEPGANEGVITDGMILSAVQALSLPDPDLAE